MRAASRLLPVLAVALLLSASPARGDDGAPVEIRLEVTDRAALERLTRLVSVYAVRDGEALAIASPAQLERLAAEGFRWRTVGKAAIVEATMCPVGWAADPQRSWTCYPSYQQYVDLMHLYADSHPALCRLANLGPTANILRPHHLWAVRISDDPDLEQAEPEVFLTSTMHGDEASGFVLLLRLIDHLLSGYGSDPEVTRLVDDLEIWINPNANPDGTYFAGDDQVAGAIRFYATSSGAGSTVDANRNFPDPDEGDHPDGNPYWPETMAMMAFAAGHTTTLSANLHDGSEVVNYPWDTWSRRHVDDALLTAVSRRYADRAQAASPPGYLTDQSNGITNGWDWYPVAGGRQDFMTYFHSAREVTVELSRVKTRPADELDELWSWNRDAMLGFMAEALTGLHGVVTDPDGEPLAATVELVGHDLAIDNSAVHTDPDVGDYHRLVAPGSYTVHIEAAGHAALEVPGVVVGDSDPTVLDAVLDPLDAQLTGRVVTPGYRRPVGGATVELLEAALETTTGADGRFSFAAVPPGRHTIRLDADGYAPVTVEREVEWPATELELALAPASFRRTRRLPRPLR